MPLKIARLGHKRIPSREGGVEVVVEELATRMAALGHDVTVYNRAGHNVAGSEFDECAVFYILSDGCESFRSELFSRSGLALEVFDADDEDGTLRYVYHVISSREMTIVRTRHGATHERLQPYINEYYWCSAGRYDRPTPVILIDDMCAYTCRRAEFLKGYVSQVVTEKAV